MKRIILILSIVISTIWLPQSISGQVSGVDLTTPLSTDPNVKIGRLDNGLVYYIRQNKKPEKRIELRLAVNAGSILENDDQQGLAHFMEHMNFNGTKTFPKNELIDFLQKTGVRFGGDINAYTGFDETVYMLQLPTDDTALVSKGFQVLEDWAHNALLDGKEIDKERGIITEEWRLGLGAQDRMMKKIFPVILKGSRYADRIPIGKVDIIKDFKHETLRDFYRDWYRPDLQAVVVVGDLDPALTETRIKNHFGGLTNPENERARTSFDLPENTEPLIAIATDKEATENYILMFYKHPLTSEKTLGDFRLKVMAEIFTNLINNRLSEISQKPESPYVFAGTGYGRFLARTRDAYIINAMSKENQIDKSLEVLLAENERVKRFGFTQTELDRQKEDMISKYEKASKEFDKTESASICSDYVSNFLSGSAIPGPQKEFKYLKNLLPAITLDEINSLVKKWVTDSNMAMVIMAPEKENVKVPTEQEVLDIIKQSKLNPLTAYVDNFREEPLVAKDITPASITAKSENADLGFTELKLSNGITVALKPTNFKNDEIVITGYSPGGNSLYPDEDFMSAEFAAQVIDMSGAGSFDNIELQKKLKGKNLQIAPYLEDVREGFRGSCAPKDFETLLQLIYLYVDQPRKDSTAFEAFMSQMENQVKFMKSSPIMAFYDTLFKSVYPGYKRMVMLPTQQQLDQVNLDKLYEIFKDRYSDAGDFKFFLVGNFQTDTIAPLLQKYLGSLPNLNRQENWKNTAPKFAAGITDFTLYKGTDPQSMVGIVMSEKTTWSEKQNLHLEMIREILGIKLVEVIREKMSGVYSPQVMLNKDHYPESSFQLVVMFGCSPKMTGKLTRAVFNEIKKLRKHGPTETDLTKAKEALIRKHEKDLQKNEFWLSKIESYYFNHDEPGSVNNFNDRVQAVTAGDLKETASSHFNPDHFVRVVLMPEKK